MDKKIETFELSVLQRALAPMPYVVLNDGLMILLTSIETAEAAADGSLMLCFISGTEMTLTPSQAQELAMKLEEGIRNAVAQRALQGAGGKIIDPFRRPQ